jgi:hypothetical protein
MVHEVDALWINGGGELFISNGYRSWSDQHTEWASTLSTTQLFVHVGSH